MKKTALVVLALVVISCATNPATGRRQLILMTEQDEIALGREADQGVRKEMGVYPDAAVQQYVNSVGQRLAKGAVRSNLTWSFTVVDESAVNAFALPGGFIYVTRGILPYLRNEAELAGVIGHEIGHVDGKHGVDQYSRQMAAGGALAGASILLPKYQPAFGAAGLVAELAFLKHGRTAELEADHLGVNYASAGGWAPQAMVGVLGTLGRLDEAQGSRRGVPNWALSHPPADDRVAKIQEAVTAAAAKGGTATNVPAFERVIDGIVVGDSREKGMVRGNEFVHPIMRFSLRFPEGWEISNSSDQVAAVPGEPQGEQRSVAMVLELSKSTQPSLEQAARTEMTAAGLVEVNGERARINGLDAYVGTYEKTIQTTLVRFRVAHVRAGQQTYVIAGMTTADQFASVDPSFLTAIRSFRELSQQEADRIQPSRLTFYEVRSGDTWASIAARAGTVTALKPETLAIMNGSDAATPPRPGTRIRLVTAGSR